MMTQRVQKEDFERVKRHIYRLTGIHLEENKLYLVQQRLHRRAGELKLDSMSAYLDQLDRLGQDHAEWQIFINSLTTNKTAWFREIEHFHFLEKHLDAYIKDNHCRRLNVWIGASSTGEEAYSLAILLKRVLGPYFPFHILSTDIDTEALKVAQAGVYERAAIKNIPKKEWSEHFLLGEGSMAGKVKIKDSLSKLVTFKQFNLQSTYYPWKDAFDFVFIRNVLIYFQQDDVLSILDKAHETARANSWLFIGLSESSSETQTRWNFIQPGIYVKGNLNLQTQSISHRKDSDQGTQKKPPSQTSRTAVSIQKVLNDKPAEVADESLPKDRGAAQGDELEFKKQGTLATHTRDEEIATQKVMKFSTENEIVVFIRKKNLKQIKRYIRADRSQLADLTARLQTIEDKSCTLKAVFTPSTAGLMPEVKRGFAVAGFLKVDVVKLRANRVDYTVFPMTGRIQVEEKAVSKAPVFDVAAMPGYSQGSQVDQPDQFAPESVFSSVIGIGSSTGGIDALMKVIPQLPKDCPPIFIAQHIPSNFSGNLAKYLNRASPLRVKMAEHGDRVQYGHVYIASGGVNLKVVRGKKGTELYCKDTEEVDGHVPSVNYLFYSLAEVYRSRVVAIVMTGMGFDGMKGARRIKSKGGLCYAQDEASSLVYGMPKAVVDEGLADGVLHLDDVARTIYKAAKDGEERRRQKRSA